MGITLTPEPKGIFPQYTEATASTDPEDLAVAAAEPAADHATEHDDVMAEVRRLAGNKYVIEYPSMTK